MIRTERLTLTPPEPRHHAALLGLLSDPIVMARLVREPTIESAQASLDRHAGYRKQGLGFWAVEYGDAIAGFCGLKPGAENSPIAGELEIGWTFGRQYWGMGLATEAARAWLDWGWANRDEPRILAITSSEHADSRRLMDRIGMRHLPELDFDHPLGDEDLMRGSVVYAIDRPA